MHTAKRGVVLICAMAASAATSCGEDGRPDSTAGQTGTATTPPSSSSGAGSEGETAIPTTSQGTGTQGATQGDTTASPTTGALTSSTSTTGELVTTGAETTTGGNTTEPLDPCEGGMGGFDFSYLWVANTTQGSISKIKTLPAANCGVYGRIQAVG